MSVWLGLFLTLVLLAANAFFVGAEFALVSARRTMIQPRAAAGSRAAKVTLRAMENVSLMMAGAQLGITICSLALGSLSEPAIAHLLEVPFDAVGVPGALLHPVAFAIALSLITYLHVAFGEMVPKNIALAEPERTALALGPPLVLIVRLLHPLIWLLNVVSNGVLRAARVEPRDDIASAFTRDEVADLVAESSAGGMLERREGELLRDALAFDVHDVASVMLSMDSVVTMPASVTPARGEQIAAGGYSRYPVISGEQLVGYVHVKDLVHIDPADPDARQRPIPRSVIRPLPDVSDTDALPAALSSMQAATAHLALVRSAAGDAVGVVTLEDVLEVLVGQIRDDSRST